VVAGCQRTQRAAGVDCTRVADVLTSFEAGTAIAPEQRAPIVAKHRATCESTKVTADEANCLYAAKDTWAAKACLPRMFAAKPVPPEAIVNGCTTLASRMRAAVMSEVGSDGSAASAQLDKLLPAIQASCEQDNWPRSVVQCAVDAKAGDMAAFQTCMNQLPPDLQQSLSRRLTAAVQPPAGQQPPGAAPTPTPTPPSQPAPPK
jgi:hypothetical protein